ncbi:glycosyltransferase family 4 protein [Halorubrum ezzemoulense]|uniref:glycosyltransferase family 4 protein n=1 Tax=Halorubrum ezzemoulense TaxID=337243 RepID=UPI00232C2D5B|nr:glycosyltransferase family 4 protein [Halorubrum ezzemoulense]MDB9281720.1 glycosyltransferase family 4 protein [Halorubrum ezzemoulense]MDB9285242.1 glycosyltransferase family 4 protein [Halorubrum ezzemoulense]
MNILQVTPTEVYPPKKGGHHRTHGLATGLSEVGDKVIRFVQSGNINRYFQRGSSWREIEQYREYIANSPPYDMARVLSKAGIRTSAFLGEALNLWTPSVLSDLINWADVILVEGPWQVRSISEITNTTPVVYSSHNVESEENLRMLETIGGSIGYRYVYNCEKEAIEYSDGLICCTSRDRDLFKYLYDADTNTIVAPNGVYKSDLNSSVTKSDINHILEDYDIQDDATVGIFVGSARQTNVNAAKYLIHCVKKLPESTSPFVLFIIGSVSEKVDTDDPNIYKTGFIEDLDPYYEIADLGFNPVSEGGGSNIKMFEYMVNGLCVVTTPRGSRGLSDFPEQSYIVSSRDNMGITIERVCENKIKMREIGSMARKYVSENMTWSSISSDLHTEIENL